MAARFHLQPLLDLAQQRSEDAAQMLQRLRQVWQEAEMKLGQLEAYLDEYRMRLQESTQGGLAIDQWRDYQTFIVKLEAAIKVQGEEIERCRLRWEQSQIEWQAREREAKAYDTLRVRHHSAEQAKEARLEQRQQDEFARNQHHRKVRPED
jgi:flagellar FliJ protein